MNITELLAQWDSNDGKPFKGSLIDRAAARAALVDLVGERLGISADILQGALA